jgi:hypothetical protein
MPKKIELLIATDPHSLKEKLEEMINIGWEIKGFVYFKTHGDSYAVLERFSEKTGSGGDFMQYEEQAVVDEEISGEKPVSSKRGNKDINISIGNSSK